MHAGARRRGGLDADPLYSSAPKERHPGGLTESSDGLGIQLEPVSLSIPQNVSRTVCGESVRATGDPSLLLQLGTGIP